MKTLILGVGPEHMAREGLAAEPAPWEDGLRADTGPGSFEWWYFDAHLDDGSTAVITYATKLLTRRGDPLAPMLTLNITRPDGHRLAGVDLQPASQFSAAKDRCAVHVGPSWARQVDPPAGPGKGPWCYELHAEAGGLAADLTFTGIVPPWRPGAAKNYYAEDLSRYFAWLPAIPFGHVVGTLTYDGQTHPVSGTGYHDHNWGNVALNEVLSHWFWGRAHIGDYTLIYVQEVSAAAYNSTKLPVFLLAKGGEILTGDGGPLVLQTADEVQHKGGRRYPRRLDWHWQSGGHRVEIALRNPQIIEATSLLGLLPRWQRVLARLVANPYYFRFNTEMELTVDFGTPETFHGPALYELMMLR